MKDREGQISKTQDEPQWIVAQGYSQHLQYLDSTTSYAKDLSFPERENSVDRGCFQQQVQLGRNGAEPSSCRVAVEMVRTAA